jgi:hypothetical protein
MNEAARIGRYQRGIGCAPTRREVQIKQPLIAEKRAINGSLITGRK